MTAARTLIDRLVWRIPPPGVLQLMADADLERLFIDRAGQRRAAEVIGGEVDRRDFAARQAARERDRRDNARVRARHRARARRLDYDMHVEALFVAAERDCCGVLLNRAAVAAGIDPASLFSGPAARARKHASEELRNWWLVNPRMTFAEWKAQSRETFDPTHPDNIRSDDYAEAV